MERPQIGRTAVLILLVSVVAGATQAQSTWISVRDRAGSSVGGAKIEILAGSSVVASAMSSGDGEDKMVLDPGTYRVRATAPGFVVGFSETFVQTADATGAVRVTLFPGSALAATVLGLPRMAFCPVERRRR